MCSVEAGDVSTDKTDSSVRVQRHVEIQHTSQRRRIMLNSHLRRNSTQLNCRERVRDVSSIVTSHCCARTARCLLAVEMSCVGVVGVKRPLRAAHTRKTQ